MVGIPSARRQIMLSVWQGARVADGWRCVCGRRNGLDATYCSSCFRGRSIAAADTGPAQGEVERVRAPSGPMLARPVVIVGIVALVALVGAILLTSRGGGDEDDDLASAPRVSGVTEPITGIDDAVGRMSTYVERARGLEFKEPVKATLLDDAAFERRLREGNPVDDARIEGRIATLRALKLLPPDFDIESALRDDLSSVIGFYDPLTDELYVRGRGDSPYVRFVLVHELTHALQDQHFDIGALLAAEGDVGLAHRALIEGDAEDIMRDYLSTLGPFEQDLVAREAKERGDQLYGRSFYLSYTNFPYVAGKQFVRDLVTGATNEQLNAAYANPPQSSEQIIDIGRYRAGDGPRPVAPPRADGTVIDQGDIGQFELAFLLLLALPVESTFRAIEGWGGSRYVTWSAGERSCTRARFVMDTPPEERELVAALRDWASAHGSATVSGATITACG
jgi:hypothetical protein